MQRDFEKERKERQSAIASIESKLDGMKDQGPHTTSGEGRYIHEELKQRMDEIEKKFVGQLQVQSCTLVMGNLGESLQDATDWVTNKAKELGIKAGPTVYHKGDDFKGIIFAKFLLVADAATMLSAWEQAQPQYNGHKVWCNEDRPMEHRACLSFLLGLRRQLCNWGYSKSAIRVDDNALTISVGGSEVASAAAHEGKMKIQWLDSAWEKWEELQQSSEMRKLKDDADEKLAGAAARRAKGMGKWKAGKDQ